MSSFVCILFFDCNKMPSNDICYTNLHEEIIALVS